EGLPCCQISDSGKTACRAEKPRFTRKTLPAFQTANHEMKYVLITPARNEERLIARTLESVVSQTVLPENWVIIDDGSADQTAEIVKRYTKDYPWIELVQRPRRPNRTFAGKVEA